MTIRGWTALVIVLSILIGPAMASDTSSKALLEVVEAGDLSRVKQLAADPGLLEVRDTSGATPLMLATRANRADMAKVLFDAGADVNAKDAINDTPFLYAGAEGLDDILTLTLPKANLADTNRYGGTALIPAAHHGHPTTVRILLDAGVDPDHVNRLGWTALLEAVILGDGAPPYPEIVRLLLQGGASPDIADASGVTPLQHAEARGYGEIAASLRAHHARQ